VLVVGGAALSLHFGMTWRTTDDVDVYVATVGGDAAARLDVAKIDEPFERRRVFDWLRFIEEAGRQRLSLMGRKAGCLPMDADVAEWAHKKLVAFRGGFGTDSVLE
jgi:hypothetical protein